MGKIYTKGTTVADEVLSGAEAYEVVQSGGGAITNVNQLDDVAINLITPVAVAGTMIDAARMNNIENGIDAIDTRVDNNETTLNALSTTVTDSTALLTTGGTTTAYTLTTTGAASLATGERFRVKFNATAGSTPTLNRDSKGAKSLKYYDNVGTKQSCSSANIVANLITDVVYDGTDYVVLDPAGIGGLSAGQITDLTDGGETSLHSHITSSIPGGRLTLTSGTPVTTSDVASSTSVYYTPYVNDVITLWDGSIWKSINFTEKTLALGTVTSGLPYDVFGYLSSGNLVLEKLAWTNGTTRATGISLQDGRYCKTGDKTRLYLGSFYTISTTQTADTNAKRFLFNAYHRKMRKLKITESTDSWTYSTASWRSWNNSTANRVEVFIGIADDLTEVTFNGVASNSGGYSMGHGIGLDSTSANSADTFTAAGSSGALVAGSSVYKNYIAVGYHYLQALEYGGASGTTTFYGDANVAYIQSGVVGWCMG